MILPDFKMEMIKAHFKIFLALYASSNCKAFLAYSEISRRALPHKIIFPNLLKVHCSFKMLRIEFNKHSLRIDDVQTCEPWP